MATYRAEADSVRQALLKAGFVPAGEGRVADPPPLQVQLSWTFTGSFHHPDHGWVEEYTSNEGVRRLSSGPFWVGDRSGS